MAYGYSVCLAVAPSALASSMVGRVFGILKKANVQFCFCFVDVLGTAQKIDECDLDGRTQAFYSYFPHIYVIYHIDTRNNS